MICSAMHGALEWQRLLLSLVLAKHSSLFWQSKRRTHWLNMPRPATESQACILIEALVRSVVGEPQSVSFRELCAAPSERFRGTIVVIEDLPWMIPGGHLAMHLDVLARCLKNVDAYLFTSSYFRLPATTEQAL